MHTRGSRKTAWRGVGSLTVAPAATIGLVPGARGGERHDADQPGEESNIRTQAGGRVRGQAGERHGLRPDRRVRHAGLLREIAAAAFVARTPPLELSSPEDRRLLGWLEPSPGSRRPPKIRTEVNAQGSVTAATKAMTPPQLAAPIPLTRSHTMTATFHGGTLVGPECPFVSVSEGGREFVVLFSDLQATTERGPKNRLATAWKGIVFELRGAEAPEPITLYVEGPSSQRRGAPRRW